MLALLRFALVLWFVREALRSSEPLPPTLEPLTPIPTRPPVLSPERRAIPQTTCCPRCMARGDVAELLMSSTAVYCTRCGWEMAVSLDLPECGMCHQNPAAVEFDGRHLCLPCRLFVVG